MSTSRLGMYEGLLVAFIVVMTAVGVYAWAASFRWLPMIIFDPLQAAMNVHVHRCVGGIGFGFAWMVSPLNRRDAPLAWPCVGLLACLALWACVGMARTSGPGGQRPD